MIKNHLMGIPENVTIACPQGQTCADFPNGFHP